MLIAQMKVLDLQIDPSHAVSPHYALLQDVYKFFLFTCLCAVTAVPIIQPLLLKLCKAVT